MFTICLMAVLIICLIILNANASNFLLIEGVVHVWYNGGL